MRHLVQISLISLLHAVANANYDDPQPTVVFREGGLKMANGENPKRSYGPKNQPPGTRMRLAALQREQFIKARDYQRKWQAYRDAQARADDSKQQPPDRDIAMETLVEVLDRRRTVHFHSQSIR